jgi:tRNA A-37 threonylcarbamoyl transferase component Bud32/pimeloyl-ACP methyl ester carboxylesterase
MEPGTVHNQAEQFDRLKDALADRYRIDRRLGAGGMATVYLAEDLKHDRRVAIKVLRPELAAVLGAERFLQEIKTTASLQHPHILPLFDSGEADGFLYYVMPYVSGETLRNKLNSDEQLSVDEALAIARAAASALDYAHRQGVVHRDVKPENILLHEGEATVADFGIAMAVNRAGGDRLTATGVSLGTPSYMSPEQAAGDREITPATDVYSLATVLYEMLAGQPPFTADTVQAVLTRVVMEPPPAIRSLRPSVPEQVDAALTRALAKDPSDRFDTAAEFAEAAAATSVGVSPTSQASSWRKRVLIAVATGVALVIGLFGYRMYRDAFNRRWARGTAIPEVERLLQQASFVDAFLLARRAERYIPEDPTLQALLQGASFPADLTTDPPGARVYYKGYSALEDDWQYVGVTPLHERFPFWYLRMKVELEGYRTFEGALFAVGRVDLKLVPDDPANEGMILVPAGSYGASGASIRLDEFWLDQYEVTNREFKAFVDAGGYKDSTLWQAPFRKDNKELSWEAAVATFLDRTGRPGPATWELASYSDGRGDYPVGGVSWYEAAAYCAFAGKSLPTLYHWYRAAGSDLFDDIVRLSNYSGEGPVPVGSYAGVGPFGAYDMAGNVKEWTWNETDGGRYILGGAWNEPAYRFRDYEAFDPWGRGENHGFRCAKYVTAPSDTALAPITQPYFDFNEIEPVDDETFAIYASFYSYDAVDLEARLEGVDSSERWRKEMVSYTAAYGDERVQAYVFLPTNAKPPFQTVVYFPSSAAFQLRSSRQLSDIRLIDFIPRSGRALVYPIYKGSYERRIDNPRPGEIARRQRTVWWSQDVQRTVDYVLGRADLDGDRLAYVGLSLGASFGLTSLGLEHRFRTAVLIAGGFHAYQLAWLPEMRPWNFAPRVTTPTLIINGRRDFVLPYETSQLPMLRLLGAPDADKRLAVFDSGHVPPWNEVIRETLDWLDRYLGPVD